MSDLLTSILRDLTGKIVGAVIGMALAAGVAIPADLSAHLAVVVSSALAVVCQIAYYIAVRIAEQRWPAAGRLLGAAKVPSYALDAPVRVTPIVDSSAVEEAVAALQQEINRRIQSGTLGPLR